MEFLTFILYFIVFSNILLLFLPIFSFFRDKKNWFLTAIFSYALAPMLVGLIFYFSIYLLPHHSDWFYRLIIFLFFTIILLFSFKNFGIFRNIYQTSFVWFKKMTQTFWFKLWLISILFWLLVIGLQTTIYPAIGDGAVYINQAKAMYEQKSDIQKLTNITTDAKNTALYNPTVRPGIPAFFASTYLFHSYNLDQNYSIFKFFSFYYYILLFILFLYLLGNFLSGKKNNLVSWFLATAVLFFFWNLSRLLIFNAKETAIYFWTFFSLWLLYLSLERQSKNKSSLSLALMLGVALGLNIFINVHGMVIALIIIFMFLILNSSTWWQKLLQLFLIFLAIIFFGGFEAITRFAPIFIVPLQSILCWLSQTLNHPGLVACPQVARADLTVHENLYGIHSLIALYLKGKLQFLTNPGGYGFLGWFFLLTLIIKFKEILKNNFLKIILLFSGLYFLIVIDPFNLQKVPDAIVLAGSIKYATLLVFLGSFIVVYFLPEFLKKILDFTFRSKKILVSISLVVFVALTILHHSIINFLANHLNLIITLYKPLSFYQQKINLLSILFLGLLALIILILSFENLLKQKLAKKILGFLLIFIFLVVPFFMFPVGKVPLTKTFSDLNKSFEYKIEQNVTEADFFKVLARAKKILPKNTSIVIQDYTPLIYNNYFNLSYHTLSEKMSKDSFAIGRNCDSNKDKVLLRSGDVELCQLLSN